jgi:DNA-binding beta-propeller fold protein YncE
MNSKMTFALTLLSAAGLTIDGCGTTTNCPTCGTTSNGTVVAITTMEVPAASPFGKPFAVWDLVVQDPVARRLYVTDRSHHAVAVFDTARDNTLGQVGPGMFVGSVCCESDRISNFNEVSGPNAVIVTHPAGSQLGHLWVSDGDSTLKVFDLDKDTLPVAHNDGTATQSLGMVRTGNAFTEIDFCARGVATPQFPNPCGDLRADEMAYDPEHNIVLVSNGDGGGGPGFNTVPFVTLVNANLPAVTDNSNVLAQFFFDGNADGTPCPTPGPNGSGVVTGTVLCRHGPLASDGIGGSIYNPTTHKFLVSTTEVGVNPADGEITEIDPVTMRVTNHFPLTGLGCLPASLAIGPSNNLLVGCANRQGEAFFQSTFILDATTGAILKSIYNVGRVDEVWYNSGDKRFYLAARDMDNGSVLGVIDAVTNMWLYNSPTGGNAHGLAVDPINNHIYVPLGVNPRCGRYSAEGCIAVYAAQ